MFTKGDLRLQLRAWPEVNTMVLVMTLWAVCSVAKCKQLVVLSALRLSNDLDAILI